MAKAKITENDIINEIDRFMDEIVDDVFANSQDNLVTKHNKVFKDGSTKSVITSDTGLLLKTGNINREKLHKQIVYPVNYAEDVEFGNNGSFVDPADLEKWVRRKLLDKRATPGQIKRAAQNIAKSLRERGQAADPFLGPAIEQTKRTYNLT